MKIYEFLLMAICFTGCSAHKQAVRNSHSHVEALKESILLVRLKDIDQRKQRLLKLGMQKKAEEEAAQMVKVNQYIRQGFAKHFDFCPVVFVLESQGKALQAGPIDTISFFDYQMSTVPPPDLTTYYVADFEKAYAEQILYEGADGQKRMAAGVGGYQALVIKDPDFIPLAKPFPNQVVLAYQKRDINQAIHDLNQSLYAHEVKAQKKRIKTELRNRRKSL